MTRTFQSLCFAFLQPFRGEISGVLWLIVLLQNPIWFQTITLTPPCLTVGPKSSYFHVRCKSLSAERFLKRLGDHQDVFWKIEMSFNTHSAQQWFSSWNCATQAVFVLSLMAQTWTLTWADASEACSSSLDVVARSFVTSWMSHHHAHGTTIDHHFMFSPFVDNGFHCGSQDA